MLSIINLNMRHLTGLCALLAAFTGITLLLCLKQWHDDWQLAHTPIAVPSASTENQTATLIASLPTEHLFGKSFSEGGDVPISNLGLQVTGILEGTDEDGNDISKAAISLSGAPAKIYLKGDILPDGIKVYNITDDAVILENNGHLEKLPLSREPLTFKPRDSEEN